MSIVFPNNTIKFYFFEIRRILYDEDGRTDLPYEKDYEFYKPFEKNDELYNQLKNLLGLKEANIDLWKKEDDNPIASLNKNSLIKISADKTASDHLNYWAKHFDYKSEPDSFDKNSIKLPINTTEITEEIEIDSHFYKYSFVDDKDMFVQINAPLLSTGNYLMWRSDFLYMIFYSKFVSISDNYQKCLKRGIKQFQLNRNVDEKNILHHFIKYYKDILYSNDKQLKIFEHVETTKEVANLYTNILIDFLTLKLKTLLPETVKPDIAQPQVISADERNEEKTVIELPENFSLLDLKIKSKALDIRETSILFYYLRKHKALVDFSDASYSKLVKLLTGHSDSNVRQRSGFGNINEILSQKRNGEKYYNTRRVIAFLEIVISDLKKNIKD